MALLVNSYSKFLSLKGWLEGKKTYFVAGAAALVFLGEMLGYINHDLATMLYKALGVTATATLAAKVNRMQKSSPQVVVG